MFHSFTCVYCKNMYKNQMDLLIIYFESIEKGIWIICKRPFSCNPVYRHYKRVPWCNKRYAYLHSSSSPPYFNDIYSFLKSSFSSLRKHKVWTTKSNFVSIKYFLFETNLGWVILLYLRFAILIEHTLLELVSDI